MASWSAGRLGRPGGWPLPRVLTKVLIGVDTPPLQGLCTWIYSGLALDVLHIHLDLLWMYFGFTWIHLDLLRIYLDLLRFTSDLLRI